MDVDDEAKEGANGETCNLFVGRLSWATDDDALYHEFAPFGEIVGCRVVYDRDSGRSKG
jgi:nucleolin